MVSGIQKCHGCVGDPQLSPKMRGSTHVPRADGDPQLSIGDPGTTFHRLGEVTKIKPLRQCFNVNGEPEESDERHTAEKLAFPWDK